MIPFQVKIECQSIDREDQKSSAETFFLAYFHFNVVEKVVSIEFNPFNISLGFKYSLFAPVFNQLMIKRVQKGSTVSRLATPVGENSNCNSCVEKA